MASTYQSQIAALLTVLVDTEEDAVTSPLGVFARNLKDVLAEHAEEDGNGLTDILVERSMELAREEEELNSTRDVIALTHDKLRAELTRVEAQMREVEQRQGQVAQQKKLCKRALNALVTGDVPCYFDDVAAADGAPARAVDSARNGGAGDRENQAAAKAGRASQEEDTAREAPSGEAHFYPTHQVSVQSNKAAPPKPAATATSSTAGNSPSSPRSSNAVSSTGLLALLRLPDVKETALLHAIESFEEQNITRNPQWMASTTYPDIMSALVAVLKHLPEPRPPVQLAELRLLSCALLATPSSNATHNANLRTVLDTLLREGDAVGILTKLLNSVNDDVKCEALECLTPLLCSSHALLEGTSDAELSQLPRRQFLEARGLEPLVNIVLCSTSEAVLERALVLLWGLLAKDERAEVSANANSGERAIRHQVRLLGGLRAVLDLLYTDSLAILENVCMVIGYITREDDSKKEIREIGGLEKITATLRHPSDSIKTKMAGAVWNCASNSENRSYLRNLGAIPALLELLVPQPKERDSAVSEFVQENAAGALWNLSVDAENKTQILDYNGIPILIHVMSTSSSISVVENVSGTLWNCSASVETRPIIRKAGGIPIFLQLLRDRKTAAAAAAAQTAATTGSSVPSSSVDMPVSDKVLDNVAGTLRNCAINDQNKPVIREAGGVELLLQIIKQSVLESKSGEPAAVFSVATVDKVASTLWILTISPEIKQAVRLVGGIPILIKAIEASSPAIAAAAKSPQRNASLLAPLAASATRRAALSTPADFFNLLYSPAALKKIPFSTPAITVGMNIKEKLVGVLRNCCTAPENRPTLMAAKTVRCLVSVVLDCFAPQTVFPSHGSGHRNASKAGEPSVQLKETIASAIWYLSRDDKVTPREQGGLELMCMFLVTPHQPSVVLEQAAGALSSLTVNNADNREAVRVHGGLQALMQLVTDKAKTEYPLKTAGGVGPCQNEQVSHSYAVLNALLTIRNCTASNDSNLRCCADAALANKADFAQALLYVVEHGSEDCAKEAVLTIKNLSSVGRLQEYLVRQNAANLLTALADRTSSESVRRAVANVLQTLKSAQKPVK